MSAWRALPVFSIAFAVLYVAAVAYGLELFVYYPALGELAWHPRVDAAAGPPMHWYGWIAFAAAGAPVVAALSLMLPPQAVRRAGAALSSLVTIGALLALGYLSRGWFL